MSGHRQDRSSRRVLTCALTPIHPELANGRSSPGLSSGMPSPGLHRAWEEINPRISSRHGTERALQRGDQRSPHKHGQLQITPMLTSSLLASFLCCVAPLLGSTPSSPAADIVCGGSPCLATPIPYTDSPFVQITLVPGSVVSGQGYSPQSPCAPCKSCRALFYITEDDPSTCTYKVFDCNNWDDCGGPPNQPPPAAPPARTAGVGDGLVVIDIRACNQTEPDGTISGIEIYRYCPSSPTWVGSAAVACPCAE